MGRFERLPEIVEFAEYNAEVSMYYLIQSEIDRLKKQNLDRLHKLDNMRKKYFDAYGFKPEYKEILKKKGIKSFCGVTL